jgi:putative endonuclease
MRDHIYFVYMLASRRNGTLYTGVTNALMRRTFEHMNDLVDGFTKKYGVHRLVWFETYANIDVAIAREKQIKGWNRAWKIKLMEKSNPGWNDLYRRMIVECQPVHTPGSPSLGAGAEAPTPRRG